mmetsp:Transcript_10911/g.14189  ORF Transcript_10911/g.14189 Transcript_10911/m.14189 type:complete len:383 (-) Transcript_10911:251-1399(-)
MSKISVVALFLAITYGVGMMLFPEYHAWTMFSLAVVTGNWDPCFFNNKYISSLFMKVHDLRLGPNPKPIEPTQVRELAKEDYSYENLRIASDNWMEPVIVRGLYADSPAVTDWKKPGGLEPLSDFDVSVVQNSTRGKDHWINCGGHPGVDSIMQRFGDALDEVNAYDPLSKYVSKTLVIPPASRSDRVPDPYLDAAIGKMVNDSLDLSKMGGSWTKGISNSALLQLWIGAGDEGATQGTGLHCDICNNFIVQLAGSKYWEFMHPKYSPLLRPTMKRGKTAISGSDITTKTEVLPYIPRMVATINEGDFMYNPDWYWHTVRNAPGYAMAIVARECNTTNFFKANPVFSGLIVANHISAGVFGGDNYAYNRMKAALFGKSLMVE